MFPFMFGVLVASNLLFFASLLLFWRNLFSRRSEQP